MDRFKNITNKAVNLSGLEHLNQQEVGSYQSKATGKEVNLEGLGFTRKEQAPIPEPYIPESTFGERIVDITGTTLASLQGGIASTYGAVVNFGAKGLGGLTIAGGQAQKQVANLAGSFYGLFNESFGEKYKQWGEMVGDRTIQFGQEIGEAGTDVQRFVAGGGEIGEEGLLGLTPGHERRTKKEEYELQKSIKEAIDLGMGEDEAVEYALKETQSLKWSNLTDADFLIFDVYGSLVRELPMLVATVKTGGALGGALGVGAATTRTGAILSRIGQTMGTTAFSLGTNSLREADSAFANALSQGLSREEAMEQADRVFSRSVVGNIGYEAATNALIWLGGPLGKMLGASSKIGQAGAVSARYLASGFFEMMQERMEDQIQSQAADPVFSFREAYENSLNFNDGLTKTDFISFALGMAFQGLGDIQMSGEQMSQLSDSYINLLANYLPDDGKGGGAIDKVERALDESPDVIQQAVEQVDRQITETQREAEAASQEAQGAFTQTGSLPNIKFQTDPNVDPSSTLYVGLSPVAGNVPFQSDQSASLSQELYNQGRYEEAQIEHNKALEFGKKLVNSTLQALGIRAKANDAYGVFGNTLEPSFDLAIPYNAKREEAITYALTRLASEDFNQKSLITYRLTQPNESVTYGADNARGVGAYLEPVFRYEFNRNLSLEQIQSVYQQLSEAGLYGGTFRNNGRILDITHVTAYTSDPNYEQFISQNLNLKESLERSGILRDSSQYVGEVRVLSEEGEGGYGDYQRAFLRENPGYADPTSKLTSRLLANHAFRFKGVTNKQEIQAIMKQPGISRLDKQYAQEVLDNFTANKFPVREFVDAMEKKLLPLGVIESTEYSSYGLNNVPELSDGVFSTRTLIFTAPIQTGTRGHFGGQLADANLYGHTRVARAMETVTDADGSTRNIQVGYITEVQSDLFQNPSVMARFKEDSAETGMGATYKEQIEYAGTNNRYRQRLINETVAYLNNQEVDVIRVATPSTIGRIEWDKAESAVPYYDVGGERLPQDIDIEVGQYIEYGGENYVVISEGFGQFNAIREDDARFISEDDALTEATDAIVNIIADYIDNIFSRKDGSPYIDYTPTPEQVTELEWSIFEEYWGIAFDSEGFIETLNTYLKEQDGVVDRQQLVEAGGVIESAISDSDEISFSEYQRFYDDFMGSELADLGDGQYVFYDSIDMVENFDQPRMYEEVDYDAERIDTDKEYAREEIFTDDNEWGPASNYYDIRDDILSQYQSEYDLPISYVNKGGATWYEFPGQKTPRNVAFQKADTTEGSISYKEGLKVLERLRKQHGVEFTTQVFESIFTGRTVNAVPEQAFGAYFDNTIALTKRIRRFTADHEFGHLLFEKMEQLPQFEGISKERILSELREEYGDNRTDRFLEERLMDKVEQYAKELDEGRDPTLRGAIRRFAEAIYNALAKFFSIKQRDSSHVKAFLQTMYHGRNTNKATSSGSSGYYSGTLSPVIIASETFDFGNGVRFEAIKKEAENAKKSRQSIKDLTPKQKEKRRETAKNLNRYKGDTKKIIKQLKDNYLLDSDIENLMLENGVRLVDTVKVKRNKDGELLSVITKEEIEGYKEGYTATPREKWEETNVLTETGRVVGGIVRSMELPALWFGRKGLSKIHDTITQAERDGEALKQTWINRFIDAGLYKKGGWFTANRFTLNKTEATNIGKYMLARQGKGYEASTYETLSPREKEFVNIFDGIIKETQDRFYHIAAKNGHELGKVDNYAPIMTRRNLRMVDEQAMADWVVGSHPSFFSTNTRETNVPIRYYETDYREIATRWLGGMSGFLTLGEVTPDIKYLINSEQFRSIVTDEDLAVIDTWFKSIVSPGPTTPTGRKLAQGSKVVRSAVAHASLGLNYASVLKQTLTQIHIAIVAKAPPKWKSTYAKKFGVDVSQLPSITKRAGDISIADLRGRTSAIFTGALTAFDKFNAEKALNALLDKAYFEYVKSNTDITPEIQQAIEKKAQDMLDMWFGGFFRGQRPEAFRNEFGNTVLMFLYPLTSELNSIVRNVMEAEGVRGKALASSQGIAAMLAMAYMEQVIEHLDFEWSDKEQMARDIFESFVGSIPLLSDITYAVMNEREFSISPTISSVNNLLRGLSSGEGKKATYGVLEFLGLPRQFRRVHEGMDIMEHGGITDSEGKMLAPVSDTMELVRSFLRGKYGSHAAQDWIRNIGVASADRRWFVPEVEFLQNGDYDRKAELYRGFNAATQRELRAFLSEAQQKRLDNALEKNPWEMGDSWGIESDWNLDDDWSLDDEEAGGVNEDTIFEGFQW